MTIRYRAWDDEMGEVVRTFASRRDAEHFAKSNKLRLETIRLPKQPSRYEHAVASCGEALL